MALYQEFTSSAFPGEILTLCYAGFHDEGAAGPDGGHRPELLAQQSGPPAHVPSAQLGRAQVHPPHRQHQHCE